MSVDLNVRRYIIVSICIAVAALLVVGTSLLPLGDHRLNIALALVIIACQALLVLGFMMHLFSERGTIYGVLGFTGFFLIFLVFLIIWSFGEIPKRAARPAPPAVETTH
jgi:caa(3)-type oxidase subunit IV